jgi:nitrite reductase/ring-hydroxylating ferredoxin subunit
MLPAHEDGEYFEFPHLHYHVDFRFVSADQWERMQKGSAYIHACIITTSLVAAEPLVQPLVCLRTMPDFPTAGEIVEHDPDGRDELLVSALQGLEAHYREQRIDTATLVCPHRGVCLKGLPVNGGVVVCPAHGLAWNVETGELAGRHDCGGGQSASLLAPRGGELDQLPD